MNSIQSRFSYSARAMVDTGRAPRDEATSIQGKTLPTSTRIRVRGQEWAAKAFYFPFGELDYLRSSRSHLSPSIEELKEDELQLSA
ncbi:hypothetical protein V6N11_055108 [Hibiscus sabdariffa]|uniref:Uncharacterized protein n=1 Tax=Hibiscus sabdariffa TaxID=183260 RepID=A0ABR1ZQB7_9ROSI